MVIRVEVATTPTATKNNVPLRRLRVRAVDPKWAVSVLAPVLLLLPLVVASAQPGPEVGQVERGQYLVHAAGCVTCHTKDEDGAIPFAGGRALETAFGTFYTPNITPDPATGIGGWSEQQFVRALKHGIAPGGEPYYPAFPYTFYAGMSDADAQAIFAYLQALEPVHRAVRAHDLRFPYSLRPLLWGWRWLYFDRDNFAFQSVASDRWQRGAYLVRHLGHCGACHTPRNFFGALDHARHLAGTPSGPEGNAVPNITPSVDGIGDWSTVDISFFLLTGFYPDGDVAGGGMNAVIQHSTGKLTKADRMAVAVYLQSVPPLPAAPGLENDSADGGN